MPELPEVETIARELNSQITGKIITGLHVFRDRSISPLNSEQFTQLLIGKTIQKVTRRAKYLIFCLMPQQYLIAHLRMTGKFILVSAPSAPEKHHRVWFHLGEEMLMIFDDPRCFGTLEIVNSLDSWAKWSKIGVEPLSTNLTTTYLRQCTSKTSRPIKQFLLDQSQIAGIGNIYASEILFNANISPKRPAQSLKNNDIQNLLQSIQLILKQAISKNGTSINNFRKVDNKTGEFQNFLKVYDKANQPCSDCGIPIQRIVQQQRSTYYCPKCQY